MRYDRDIRAENGAQPHWDRPQPPQYRPRTRPRRKARSTRVRLSPFIGAVLALALFSAGAAIAWGKVVPVPVKIDGNSVRLPAGATLQQVRNLGLVDPPSGVVHAIDGSVLETATGPAGIVAVNGVPVEPQTRLRWGDELTTARGAEATEAVLERKVAISFKTIKRGFGDQERVTRKGKKGVALERYGELSGMVVSSEVVRKPVNRIVQLTGQGVAKPGEKVVALTFDDGPWKDQTLRMLDILDRYGIKATFFMLGSRVRVDGKTAAEVARRGHLLGNHSYSHPILTGKPSGVVISEIERTNAQIRKATGKTPHWFRAPGGAVDASVRSIVEARGMRVAHWTNGTGDWKNLGAARVVKYATQVRPGGVILVHDGGGTRDQTIQALPQIIETLQAKGYRFVTLDQLASVPGAGSAGY